jgi:(S)-ureidoglycine aminohydrolase
MSTPGARGVVVTRDLRPEEGLAGSRGWVRVPIDGRVGARHLVQRAFRFGPGATPELRNDGSDDVMYVVEGRGSAIIGGGAHELAPGTAAFAPAGVTYAVENEGPHELVVISVLSPPPGSDQAAPGPPSGGHRYAVREEEEPPLSAGRGRTFKVLIDPRHGCRTVTQFVGSIESGTGAPPHRHRYEEALYVLEGEGAAWIDGEDHRIDVGDSVFLPPGTPHRVEATGVERLQLLGVFSPPGSPASRTDLPS